MMSKLVRIFKIIYTIFGGAKDMCNLNHQMNAYDKQYLDYMLRERGKMNILGFLISINLAIYAGIYASNERMLLPLKRGAPFLLALFVLIINCLFAVIYHREHALDELISDLIKKKVVIKNLTGQLEEASKKIRDQDFPNKGKTWRAIKGLLSLIVVVPISLIIVSLLTWVFQNCETINKIINRAAISPFVWLLLCVGFLWWIVNAFFEELCLIIFRNKE